MTSQEESFRMELASSLITEMATGLAQMFAKDGEMIAVTLTIMEAAHAKVIAASLQAHDDADPAGTAACLDMVDGHMRDLVKILLERFAKEEVEP